MWTDASKPAKPPKRRRWRRRFFIALFALGLLIFFAPWIVARTGAYQFFINKALADFGGQCRVGGASLGWFSPVELRDVKITDSQGRTLLAAPKITTSKTLAGFLADRRNLGSVTIEQPAVEIVYERGTTNLEESLKKLLEKPRDPAGPTPTLQINVANATLKIIDADAKRDWTFSEITARVDTGVNVHVGATIAQPQRLEFDATIGPQFAATLQAEKFPIDALGPLLRRFEPGLELTGALSGQVATESQGDATSVAGSLAIVGFNAASPRLGSERIALEKLELPFKFESSGRTIRVDHARLTCSLGDATLKGSVNTELPAEKLLQQPGLSASASLDVARLAKMLPNLLRLRPGTELQEGRVEIHLASQAVAAGVAWDGQLKTTALRGSRDGKALRWEQPILASFRARFDDQLRPDFEKLEAASDFAAVSARGKLENFNAEATVSLDALTGHLGEFIDLTGITLAGTAKLTASGRPENSGTTIAGALKLNDLQAAYREKTDAAPGWQFGGRGDLAATVRFDPQQARFDGVAGTLENLRFRGFGVDIDEPVVKVLPTDIAVDRAANRISIPKLQFATQTVSLGADNVVITENSIAFRGAANADLARLQKTMRLGGEPMGGIVRAGAVELSTQPDGWKFVATLPVDGFYYGPQINPLWSEPKLTLRITGDYDAKADALKLDSASLERPDGLAATAAGRISELSTKQVLDLAGHLKYDLAAFEPQLRQMLGPSVKAIGADRRPFHLQGSLDDLTLLVGDASLGWQSLRAYGFDVGTGQLNAKLQQGVLTTNAVEAAFGTTGKLKLEPSLKIPSGELSFRKGRVFENATLTPAICADALGYALPAIAKSTQAEGTISFDLEDHRIPLNEIDRTAMKGTLTLHNVTVTAGPVIRSVAELLNAKNMQLTLAKEQGVNVWIENGRVYHKELTLAVAGYTLRTSGSVGFDGTLNLTVHAPLPESAIGPLLKNTPKIRDALVNKTIAIPIAGTLAQPKLDRNAFNAAVAQFVKEVTRDAAKGAIGDLLKKSLEPPPKKP